MQECVVTVVVFSKNDFFSLVNDLNFFKRPPKF